MRHQPRPPKNGQLGHGCGLRHRGSPRPGARALPRRAGVRARLQRTGHAMLHPQGPPPGTEARLLARAPCSAAAVGSRRSAAHPLTTAPPGGNGQMLRKNPDQNRFL
jgi:hypothetical protein